MLDYVVVTWMSLLMFNFLKLVILFFIMLYHFYTEGGKLVFCKELFELNFYNKTNVSNKFSFLIRQLLGLGCDLDRNTAGVRNVRKFPYYTVCVLNRPWTLITGSGLALTADVQESQGMGVGLAPSQPLAILADPRKVKNYQYELILKGHPY